MNVLNKVYPGHNALVPDDVYLYTFAGCDVYQTRSEAIVIVCGADSGDYAFFGEYDIAHVERMPASAQPLIVRLKLEGRIGS